MPPKGPVVRQSLRDEMNTEIGKFLCRYRRLRQVGDVSRVEPAEIDRARYGLIPASPRNSVDFPALFG